MLFRSVANEVGKVCGRVLEGLDKGDLKFAEVERERFVEVERNWRRSGAVGGKEEVGDVEDGVVVGCLKLGATLGLVRAPGRALAPPEEVNRVMSASAHEEEGGENAQRTSNSRERSCR